MRRVDVKHGRVWNPRTTKKQLWDGLTTSQWIKLRSFLLMNVVFWRLYLQERVTWTKWYPKTWEGVWSRSTSLQSVSPAHMRTPSQPIRRDLRQSLMPPVSWVSKKFTFRSYALDGINRSVRFLMERDTPPLSWRLPPTSIRCIWFFSAIFPFGRRPQKLLRLRYLPRVFLWRQWVSLFLVAFEQLMSNHLRKRCAVNFTMRVRIASVMPNFCGSFVRQIRRLTTTYTWNLFWFCSRFLFDGMERSSAVFFSTAKGDI